MAMNVKRIVVALICAVVAGVLFAMARPGPDGLDRAVESVLTRGAEAAVVVWERGETREARSYGRAASGALTPQTRMRLASLTKPVTSAAIMELVARDALSLDATVADLLPGLPFADPRAAAITLRDLLRHSSGIDEVRGVEPLFMPRPRLAADLGIDAGAQQDCREIAQAVIAQPLGFDPGTAYIYSNTGYCLLGLILEAQTGQPLEAALHGLVPEATGLSLDIASLDAAGAVGVVEVSFLAMVPEIVGAAGGLIGSADAYLTFLARPLTPEVTAALPYETQGPTYMGLGWRVWPGAGCPARTHFGSMPGMFSVAVVGEDGARFVALFTGRPDQDFAAFVEMVEGACAAFASLP